MALVVLDTDVTSRVIKGTLPDSLAAKLVGKQMIVSFVTVGELSRWTVLRDLGERRRTLVDSWITSASIGAGLGGRPQVGRDHRLRATSWPSATARRQLDRCLLSCVRVAVGDPQREALRGLRRARGARDHHSLGTP